MQHQRDAALAGVTGVAPRRAVALDVLGELLDRLAEQVGEHVDAERAGPLERRRRAGRREPDRQLGLHRAGQRAHVDRLRRRGRAASTVSPRHSRCTSVDRCAAGPPWPWRSAVGLSTKSLGCQPAANEMRDAAAARGCRRPPTPRRRGSASAAAARRCRRGSPTCVGDRGERGAGHARVRVGAAEGVEVALGRPHRLEAVAVGERGRSRAAGGSPSAAAASPAAK